MFTCELQVVSNHQTKITISVFNFKNRIGEIFSLAGLLKWFLHNTCQDEVFLIYNHGQTIICDEHANKQYF